MKKNRPSAAYLSAVVAGLIAGSSFASSAQAQDKTPAPTAPTATQKDRNSCGGPNGCGGKKAGEKKAGPEATDKHACKGQNACKGHNECKGKGGCATDGKAHTQPTQKPA